jgi:hypothetical protein
VSRYAHRHKMSQTRCGSPTPNSLTSFGSNLTRLTGLPPARVRPPAPAHTRPPACARRPPARARPHTNNNNHNKNHEYRHTQHLNMHMRAGAMIHRWVWRPAVAHLFLFSSVIHFKCFVCDICVVLSHRLKGNSRGVIFIIH